MFLILRVEFVAVYRMFNSHVPVYLLTTRTCPLTEQHGAGALTTLYSPFTTHHLERTYRQQFLTSKALSFMS